VRRRRSPSRFQRFHPGCSQGGPFWIPIPRERKWARYYADLSGYPVRQINGYGRTIWLYDPRGWFDGISIPEEEPEGVLRTIVVIEEDDDD